MNGNNYTSLARRMILFIVPIIFGMAVLIGLFFGSYDRQQEKQHLTYSHQVLHRELANLLADPLYYFEYRVVEAVTETVYQRDNIVYISLTDELDNKIINLGEGGHSDVLVLRQPVKFPEDDTILGYLEAGYLISPQKPFYTYYLYPLLIALLLTTVFSIALVYVWRNEVSIPLLAIHSAMEKSQGGVEAKANVTRHNELGFIAETYNDMLDRITTHRLQVEKLANHDALTGLKNRYAFAKSVNQKITDAAGKEYWLMFIDVDRFKWINDTYGHLFGDDVLKEIAKRLSVVLPDAEISRFGGDEFVVLTEKTTISGKALLKTIKQVINQPIRYEHDQLRPSVCVGVVCYPQDGDHYESLLQRADAAMYQAKILGRDANFFYDKYLDDVNRRELKIANILQTYILEDCIDVYFQPIFDSAKNSIISAESLLRLPNISHNQIDIGTFILIAEQSGFIKQIDQISRRKSFSYFAKWRDEGIDIKDIHVNTSVITFNTDEFVEQFLEDIRLSRLLPSDIVLEITETAIFDNIESAIQKIQKIKAAGVKVALDDYGSGYSSISLLLRLPIDIIKFDQSFFQTDEKNTKQRDLILKHSIAMAKDLEFEVIMEGVEKKHLVEKVNAFGCENIQGFIFGKPMSADDFVEHFKRSQAGPNPNAIMLASVSEPM